jgi:hypothetical protein
VLPAGLPLLAALGGLGTRWNGWRNWGGRGKGLGLGGRRSAPGARSSRDGEAGPRRELWAGGKR